MAIAAYTKRPQKTTENDRKRSEIVNDIRFVKKRRKRRKLRTLPKHVFEVKATGNWFVRRHFATEQRTASGRPVYIQVVRRCDPQTEERAREVYDEIGMLRNAETPAVSHEHTVESFVSTYLEIKRSSVASRTAEGNAQLFRLYIKDSSFGRLPLRLVVPFTVQDFYQSLQRQGVSGAMVRKVHRLLSAAFGLAVIWGNLPQKPKGVILPRDDVAEIQFLSRSQARKLSQVCLKNPEFLILALALETGMRPGEYLALRWRDLDLSKQRLTVHNAISFLRSGRYEIKGPKTRASKRSFGLSDNLTAALRQHRERYNAMLGQWKKRANASITIDHPNARKGRNYETRKLIRKHAREILNRLQALDLVFPAGNGHPIAAHNLGVRTMRDACMEAGLEPRSLYSLRHTAATILLTDGVDVKTVAERLGTSPQMIWRTYGHVVPETRSAARDKISAALYDAD